MFMHICHLPVDNRKIVHKCYCTTIVPVPVNVAPPCRQLTFMPVVPAATPDELPPDGVVVKAATMPGVTGVNVQVPEYLAIFTTSPLA